WQANTRLLPEPDSEESFCARAASMTFEEDENSAAWIVAQTRLGEESVNVIPLERVDDHTCRLPDGDVLDLRKPAARDMQLRLLRRSLRVSRYEAVQAIKLSGAKLPALFRESALLKGYVPLWLNDGQAQLPATKGTLTLSLDPRLGLVIAKTHVDAEAAV
ncbi:MAG: hypothetical protein M1546_17925, partial [Chloroflexi bacterium]|nr:hypothetical protein [Chloroflexota bacterium]